MRNLNFPIWWILILLGYFALIVGLRATHLSVYQTPSGRAAKSGDGFSDVGSHSAIKFFYDHGHRESAWRPMLNYDHGTAKENAVPYTHYPALAENLGGVYARLIGTTNETLLRTLPILASLLFVLFQFYFLRCVLRDERMALVSLALIVGSNYMLAWSDGFHKHTWEQIVVWVFVFGLWRFYVDKARGLGVLVLLAACAVLMSQLSFEGIAYFAVMVCGYSLFYERGWRRVFAPINLTLGTLIILGFVFHLYLNSVYFGSWSLALTDMSGAFLHRTGACADVGKCGLSLLDKLTLPLDALNRIEKIFLIPGYALLGLSFLCARRWRVQAPDLYRLLLIALVASFCWYLLMPQHAKVHQFVGRHAGLLFGLVAGPGLKLFAESFRRVWEKRETTKIVLGLTVTLYVVAMAFTQQIWPYHWRDGLGLLLR